MTTERRDGQRSGDRACIGVLAPAAGTVLDREWSQLLPDGVSAPSVRVQLDGGTPTALEAFILAAETHAFSLAPLSPTVVVLACALATAFRGASKEGEVLRKLTVAAGCPALGMASSAMSALRVLGARRVAMLTPYDARSNAWLGEYLSVAGFEPTCIGTLPVGPAAAADLAPQDVAMAARGLLASAPGTDALWVACGNVRTLEIVEELESQSGCAVVSSNLALLWASLRKCGIPDRIVRGGRLWLH